jgi:hypothetical protein
MLARMKKSALLAVIASLLGFVQPAAATGVSGPPTSFSVSVASSIGGDHLDLTPVLTASGGSFAATASGTTPSFSFSASFTLNADPTLSGSFMLTNLSGITQIFSVSATLGVPGIPSPVSFHGSYGEATYTDANQDGMLTFATPTLLLPGTEPFMTGEIDGSSVGTIGAFNNTPSGGGGIFGTQGPEAMDPGSRPGVSSSIGTAFAFALSPGDTVSTPFEFVVVPEPAGVSSFAIFFALFVCRFAQKRASRLE